MSVSRSLLVVAMLSTPLVASNDPQHQAAADPSAHSASSQSEFVQEVRRATEPFRDSRRVPAGYGAALGCVNGPDQGAMGVHFVNGALLMDGVLNIREPEALIYEFREGVGRLVGVEYIVLAEVWHLTHAENDPPTVGGQLMNFYDAPNRFGLKPFYELHVWAWRDNPNGAFVDWNPRVSCENR